MILYHILYHIVFYCVKILYYNTLYIYTLYYIYNKLNCIVSYDIILYPPTPARAGGARRRKSVVPALPLPKVHARPNMYIYIVL